MKKTTFILGLFIIFSLFIGQVNFVEAGRGVKIKNNSSVDAKILEVKEPKILPTSPFYFLKEWQRNIRQFFTFNPVKKAELELKYADEKLAEFSKVVDENCGENELEVKSRNDKNQCSQVVLGKALNNYLKAQEKLEKRLKSLPENKNIDELLNKLGERIFLHQALFDEIINEAPLLEAAIKEGGKTVGAGQITEIIKRVGGFDSTGENSGTARKNKAELIDAIAKGTKAINKLPYPEGIKELKALEILTRVEESLPEESKKKIKDAKENIEKMLLEEGKIKSLEEDEKLKSGFIYSSQSDKIVIDYVPFEIEALEKVLDGLEEKTKGLSPIFVKPNIANLGIIEKLKAITSDTIRQISKDKGGDYLPASARFKLELDGVLVAEFKKVSGIDSEIEEVAYKDPADLIRKRPGRIKYRNITLGRGLLIHQELRDWYRKVAKGIAERKSGSIIVLDRAGQELMRYNFFEAWPVKFKGDDYSIEEIELKVEGGVIVGKKITPDKAENGSKQIPVSGVCPLIAPDTSKGKEECLKAAKELNEKHPGCNYAKICEEISEKPSLDCGLAPGAPGNWKCINGDWKDVSQCGKIYCLRYDPVCGADGKTYSCGEIDAESCGIEMAYKGECKKEKFPSSPVSSEQPTTSSEGIPAQQLPQPIFCNQEWNPVCGSDNKTYSNECMTKAAGVTIQYKGECRAETSY